MESMKGMLMTANQTLQQTVGHGRLPKDLAHWRPPPLSFNVGGKMMTDDEMVEGISKSFAEWNKKLRLLCGKCNADARSTLKVGKYLDPDAERAAARQFLQSGWTYTVYPLCPKCSRKMNELDRQTRT